MSLHKTFPEMWVNVPNGITGIKEKHFKITYKRDDLYKMECKTYGAIDDDTIKFWIIRYHLCDDLDYFIYQDIKFSSSFLKNTIKRCGVSLKDVILFNLISGDLKFGFRAHTRSPILVIPNQEKAFQIILNEDHYTVLKKIAI
jgi:hypothetical protein